MFPHGIQFLLQWTSFRNISLSLLCPDKTIIQKDICTQCSQQHYLQQHKHSHNLHVHQQMDKDVLHICNGILLGHKKNCVAIWRNTEEPRAYHTKWRKSKTERKIPYNIIYVWNLKYDTNELIYRTDSQPQRADFAKEGWGRDGLRVWDGISRCKLVYIEW